MIPSDIAALTCWLTADSISQADDTLTPGTWTDLSGAGHHGTRAGGSYFRGARTPMGGPSFQFKNAFGGYTLGSIMAGTTSGEAMVVVRAPDTSSEHSGPWRIASNDYSFWTYSNGITYDGAFTGTRFSWAATLSQTQFRVFGVSHSGSVYTARIDGAVQTTQSTAYAVPTGLLLGDSGSPYVGFGGGEIAEFLLFTRELTAPERAGMLAYLTVRHIEDGVPKIAALPPDLGFGAASPAGTGLYKGRDTAAQDAGVNA